MLRKYKIHLALIVLFAVIPIVVGFISHPNLLGNYGKVALVCGIIALTLGGHVLYLDRRSYYQSQNR